MPYLRAFLSSFLLMAAMPEAEATEPATLPGGVWAIVPPPGFEMTLDPIAAFRHPDGAGIVIHDQPRSPVTRAEFERERAGSVPPGGLRIEEVEEVTVGGKRGLLIVTYSPAQQRTNVQLQIEGAASNGVIDAVVTDAAGSVSPDVLKRALLTAEERPSGMEERLASLPFVIGDLASLRVARITIGPAVVLTDGPVDFPGLAADQTFATVQTGRLATAPADLGAALEAMREQTRRMVPDAIDFSARLVEEEGEQIAEISYRRLVGRPGAWTAGVAWSRVSEGRLVTALCQYPFGDEAAKRRLRRLFDSVSHH